jgi:hypothetical protein
MTRRPKKSEVKAAAVAAASPPVPALPAAKAEVRYPMSVWMEDPKALLGVARYTVVGALSDVDIPEHGFTKSELEAHINRFLSKPVS